MNSVDIILIILISVMLILAIRRIFLNKARKKNCSGCCFSCTGCIHEE